MIGMNQACGGQAPGLISKEPSPPRPIMAEVLSHIEEISDVALRAINDLENFHARFTGPKPAEARGPEKEREPTCVLEALQVRLNNLENLNRRLLSLTSDLYKIA